MIKVCPCGKEFVTTNERRIYCCPSHRVKACMLRKHKQKKENGQSLVELAVSLIFLMLVLGGIVEFGIALFQFVQLRDAAQEGAIFGSACPDLAQIEERVRYSSNTPIDLSDSDRVFVEISLSDFSGVPKDISQVKDGDAMTVRVSFSHKIFMPFIPQILQRGDLPLNASVTNTVLRSACQ